MVNFSKGHAVNMLLCQVRFSNNNSHIKVRRHQKVLSREEVTIATA